MTVFWGTSNERDILTDATGGTRYYVLEMPDGYRISDERMEWLEAVRDQIWSTAVSVYNSEGIVFPDTSYVATHNEQFEDLHPWHEPIAEWVAHTTLRLTTTNILEHVIKMDLAKQGEGNHAQIVQNVMRRLGYKSMRARIPGTSERCYVWKKRDDQ